MLEQKQFLRPSEIAPVLGLTTGRIYQLISAGEIPSTRVGGAIRIPRVAWDSWLASHSTRALGGLQDSKGRLGKRRARR